MFIHVIYFLQFFLNKKSVNKDKLLQCCRHCRFSNGLHVETVLVDVLEQDCQACYDAVRIAGSVLNTKS